MPQTRKIVSLPSDQTIKVFPHWVARMNQLGADGIPFLFILDFDLASPLVLTFQEVSDRGIRFEINKENQTSAAFQKRDNEIPFKTFPVDQNQYRIGFDDVKSAIQAGDTYLLNLCYSTYLDGLPTMEEIYQMARAPYKLWMPDKFVVFSPESFVEIKEGIISTFPMKGTIDANIPKAKEILLADIKEQEEHATVVDLLRNDLSIVALDVQVVRYRYVSEIKTSKKTLLQCSSEIRGRLPGDYLQRLGDIFYSLLPAGSVTGAPKKKTIELIHEIESEPRRYYTGVFGVFDGESLDSAVMIRMIEQRPDGCYYRSGGGITYRSVMEQEYQEMLDKVYIPI